MISVATWNVNSLGVRLEHLLRFVREANPDVLCLQETKLTDDRFPALAIRAAGYTHQLFVGEKAYNGVALLSKQPIEGGRIGFLTPRDGDQPRLVTGVVAGIRIVCVYVPNGGEVGTDRFREKLGWYQRLRDDLAGMASAADPVVVCGDFNVAPDDGSVWDPFECEGQLLYHPDERAALQDLMAWGLHDAYREKNPFSTAFTWWDYRMRGFEVNRGMRIDHHLVSQPLLRRCTKVTIWRDVRGWKQPSDHVPVVAEFST